MSQKQQHNSILYGIAAIIVIAVSIIPFLSKNKQDYNIDGYFKGVRKLPLVSADGAGRWLPGGRAQQLDSIVLKNQDDSIVDLVNDKHDFKLIAVTSLSSRCKEIIESMSMVKKGLAKYISIEAFAVLGDSLITPAELNAYRANNNFDVQCLYTRTFDEVSRLSRYQLCMVLDREIVNGKADIVSDMHILLVHAGKPYYFSGISSTAQEITYAILSNFTDDIGKLVAGAVKDSPGRSSFMEIAADAKQMELTRQFDYDCGGVRTPKVVCR